MLQLNRNSRNVPVFLLLWTCVSSTVISSMPAAPLFAFTLLKALFRFLLYSIFSSCSGCTLSRSFHICQNYLRAPAYSSCSALSFCGQPSSVRFSAMFGLSSFSRLYLELLLIRPFTFRLLWPLLTSARSAWPSGHGYSFRNIPCRPPRVPHVSFPHLPAASATACSVQLLDFGLDRGLIPGDSLYTVSVRQAGGLPPASFRFHLTMDTFVFGCIFPAAGQIPDFHRLGTCAAGHTTATKELPQQLRQLLFPGRGNFGGCDGYHHSPRYKIFFLQEDHAFPADRDWNAGRIESCYSRPSGFLPARISRIFWAAMRDTLTALSCVVGA